MSKTVLVTGTSSGFGRLIVETLANAGHTVFATMRDIAGRNSAAAEEIRDWASKNDKHVDVVELDVASDESVRKAAATVLDQSGGIDVVVNNAGITMMGLSEAATAADFQRVFDVNVYGVARVTNAFLPKMREKGDGLFITVSSIMGRITIPFAGVYTASKWAVEGLVETYRYELSLLGIDNVIIEPGAFPTDIINKSLTATNAAVTEQYGPVLGKLEQFGKMFEEMLSGDDVTNPQDVADAVKNVIDTPRGQRPLRVIVDTLMADAPTAINNATVSAQKGLLDAMGMGDMEGPAA